jgi:hypothetical protein
MFAGFFVSVVAVQNLSSVEQGYFFTFLSIAASQALFELGATNLILHHLSHAQAGLRFAKDGVQKREAQDLVESTRAYSLRYFGLAATLFTVVIGISGTLFFALSHSNQSVNWQLPWALMVAGTALSLFNLNYYSYLEAFGRLSVSYRVRIASTILLIVAFSVTAFSVGGMLCYPLALLISNGFALVVLRRANIQVNQEFDLGSKYTVQHVDIGREQRKMAASAVAGYVTSNTLTPYAFHFFGAQTAGQVGLTMSIFTAIAAIAMARTTAEAPTYGPLIASGALTELMHRFRKTQIFSIRLTIALGLVVIAARQIFLALAPKYDDRFMHASGFVVMGLLIVSNVTLSVTSTVLRAFKTEQLMWPSLVAAALVMIAQLVMRLEPVQCLTLLAAFNGLVFYPFAQRRLSAQISVRHA